MFCFTRRAVQKGSQEGATKLFLFRVVSSPKTFSFGQPCAGTVQTRGRDVKRDLKISHLLGQEIKTCLDNWCVLLWRPTLAGQTNITQLKPLAVVSIVQIRSSVSKTYQA